MGSLITLPMIDSRIRHTDVSQNHEALQCFWLSVLTKSYCHMTR